MTIGIICAMEKEIKKYQEVFDLELKNEKLSIYEGTYQDKKIILALSGIGKVNAAINTQYLIDTYQLDYIINSGCCGSLVESVKVLDTILVSYATYHDFTPLRIMESCVPDNGKIKVDEKMFQLTENILKENHISYKIGGIASGDCFVTSSTMRDDIYERTGCIAVDMESASISHTVSKNNIPFLIIRSISDFADGTVEQEEKAARIAANITHELINRIK